MCLVIRPLSFRAKLLDIFVHTITVRSSLSPVSRHCLRFSLKILVGRPWSMTSVLP